MKALRCGLWLALAASAVAGEAPAADVVLRSLAARDRAFAEDIVQVEVVLTSPGYAGRTVEITLELDGQEVARKGVRLSGEPQTLTFRVQAPPRGGAVKLTARVPPLPGEATAENNRLERLLLVSAEPIRVLYLDGAPRWEYRYLRTYLLRDRGVEPRFLLASGDPDAARESEHDLTSLPDSRKELFRFDLVLLGDVPPRFLSRAQLDLLHELVRDHGGGLAVLPGAQHGLAGYVGTPIQAMLPVRLQPDGWHEADAAVHPVPTEAGLRMGLVRLGLDEEENAALWKFVKPLGRVPALAGPKPGAEVLATLPGEPPYPLIAWQRYGRGAVLFVGTDDLWRLRYGVGDKYHARFWRQALRLLAAERAAPEGRDR